ncbi:MAG: NAD-dependent epimerase/dehydratase family protein [Coriobacteriia bacterium]|nr:NAD-dependent epimerase/dehydratase family protein [Coriobacteriia bacterium]
MPPSLEPTGAMMTGRQCVVFGGSGFMGSHIVSRLISEGASVRSLDLAPCPVAGAESVCGDITDAALVTSVIEGVDHIYCFAGGLGALRSLEEPVRDLETSAGAQLVLLEAVRAYAPEASVVFAGSRLEYGTPERLPLSEDHPRRPSNPYALHKALCSDYYHLYARLYGLHTVVLRLPNPYGPHIVGGPANAGYGILNLFVDCAIRCEPIRLYGDGSQLRDFVHVDDVVSAAVAASLTPDAGGRAINIGSGVGTSLLEAANLVMTVCGSGTVLTGEPWPLDAASVETGDYYFDISIAREVLNWAPTVSLEQGLATLLESARSR